MTEKPTPPVIPRYNESVECMGYKCGGYLVERRGKFGTFFGCTNYPKCAYTMNERDMNSRLGLDNPDESDWEP